MRQFTKRQIRNQLFALTTLSALAAAATSGCAENDSMLYVQGVLVPDPPPDCTVAPDQGATLYQGGVMDVMFTTGYVGVLLVGNQVTQRGAREELKTETSRIAIRGAEVQILTASQDLITEFTVPATGFVDQAAGSGSSYGSAAVTLIDSGTGASLAQQVTVGSSTTVVIEVRVFGDTLGGSEITSAALTYPITVCRGCLISCPSQPPSEEGVCQLGADEAIDCRSCGGFPQGTEARAACDAAGGAI